MNSDDAFRPIHLNQHEPFRWQGVEEHVYKAENELASFKESKVIPTEPLNTS